MRRLWVHRDVDAPAPVLWELLVNPEHWSTWGPSVSGAVLDGSDMRRGARGVVVTVGGLRMPFEVTVHEPGARWAWSVAGVPATDHTVEPLGPDRCRVGFGVPWIVAPYVAICWMALTRLDGLATENRR